MIRAKLTYHPAQANPARLNGKGVWRIVRCWPASRGFPVKVFRGDDERQYLYINADRTYKTGSRVDPAKVALAALPAVLDERYSRLEREHYGDPDKRAGIYAPR